MKKILSLVIVLALSCVFALPAFASQTIINGKNYTNLEKYNYVASGFSEHTIQDFIDSARSLDSMSAYPYYFAYPFGVDSNGIGNVMVICSKCPKLEFDSETHTLHTPSTLSSDFGVIWAWNVGSTSSCTESVSGFYLPDDFPLEKLYDYTNMTFENVPKPFNPNEPPAVFNYSCDNSSFVLENNKVLNVLIDYTPEYLSWCTQWLKHFDSYSIDQARDALSYDFCVYVSTVKPTDTETLLSSLENSRYVNLNYTTYVYEGGVGSAILNEQNSERDVPKSQSGKSPWTTAQGACICNHIAPHYDRETNVFDAYTVAVPVYLENIKGFDSHTPLYVCVFAAYSGGNVSPNSFTVHNLETALHGHSTPNDTFSEFFETHTEDENSEPDYTLHTYYYPFENNSCCVGDGFQGDCVYKPQNVRGKDYDSDGSVFGFTNKSDKVVPDKLHDIDMKPDQWVKPEDYSKWQYDFYQRQKYSNEFTFNTQNLKEIFDKESSFFDFIKVSFNVFPEYIMHIFEAFIIALFAIIILKRIL